MTTNPTYPVYEAGPEADLDELLAEWYERTRGYKMTRGYSSSDSTCRDYRAPGHYDWANGATQARGDELRIKAVGVAIDTIKNEPRRWNTAIQFEAMNLHCGAAVWSSPMLPRDKAERDVLIREARNMLLRELIRTGVLG